MSKNNCCFDRFLEEFAKFICKLGHIVRLESSLPYEKFKQNRGSGFYARGFRTMIISPESLKKFLSFVFENNIGGDDSFGIVFSDLEAVLCFRI